LFKEHLGNFYTEELDDDFDACFRRFQEVATMNQKQLESKRHTKPQKTTTKEIETVNDAAAEFEKYNTDRLKKNRAQETKSLELLTKSNHSSKNPLTKDLTNWPQLVGRPVFMVPEENYHLLLRTVYYPNKLMKLFTKIGLAPNLTENLTTFLNKMKDFRRFIPKL
jgi:hypothetical protein